MDAITIVKVIDGIVMQCEIGTDDPAFAPKREMGKRIMELHLEGKSFMAASMQAKIEWLEKVLEEMGK